MCLQLAGLPLCLGTDAMDLVNHQMVRFVAPVTMLATGGLGQVCQQPALGSGLGFRFRYRGPSLLALLYWPCSCCTAPWNLHCRLFSARHSILASCSLRCGLHACKQSQTLCLVQCVACSKLTLCAKLAWHTLIGSRTLLVHDGEIIGAACGHGAWPGSLRMPA